MKRLFAALAVAAVWGCAAQPAEQATAAGSRVADNHLVNKVWLATNPSAAPGTIRLFLSDGSLVMDSCFETYRLARWKRLTDRRIEWTEDTARIEAEIVELSENAMRIRLHLAGEVQEQSYRVADVPSVCPDMPR